MTLEKLKISLRLPVIASPLFILSNPRTVVAQCCAGVVGSFPALNARGEGTLKQWLQEIKEKLEKERENNRFVAPYAVNQIVHASNSRLEKDLRVCVDEKVPITITSLRSPNEVVHAVKSYGGLVFHDVISLRHAEKAIEAGVDGLILVATGAGGHAGTLNPFALVTEVRKIYSGPLVLAGSITNGSQILAAQVMGADFVYMGTKFICSAECPAPEDYKDMIIRSSANDIVYTNFFTGIYGSYLKESADKAGYNSNKLFSWPRFKLGLQLFLGRKLKQVNFSSFEKLGSKAWKDIWSAGQGVGDIDQKQRTAEIVSQLIEEYSRAKEKIMNLL
ncbi:nitronate monooxygenase family protein [Betaproteobacteria bacterium]|nr:nitronate monooxygenase family protein [Betaproteobacteria bacterium]